MTNLGDSAGEWGGGPALGLVGNAFGIRAALAAGAAALTPALLLYGLALRRGDETHVVRRRASAGKLTSAPARVARSV